MKKALFYSLFLFVFVAKANKYTDLEIRKIIELQHNANTSALLGYFKSTNASHKKQAIMAFATLKDTTSIAALLEVAKLDKSAEMKALAAFALGQQAHKNASLAIANLIQKEKLPSVKAKLMEALGKCGDKDALDYLVQLKFKKTDTVNTLGQAKALFYFVSKDIISASAVQLAIDFMHPEQGKSTREITSYTFSRIKKYDLSDNFVIVTILALHEKNETIRRNMAFALNRLRPEYAMKAFQTLMKKETSAQVRISALRGMKNLEYDSVKTFFFSSLNHKNQYVRQTASEMLLQMGKNTDAQVYMDKATAETDWIIRSILYSAALKFAPDKNKIAYSATIKSAYEASGNAYEKGALLKALANHLENHEFIAKEVFKENTYIIKTNGFEALMAIRKESGFTKTYTAKLKQKVDLRKIFWGYTLKALQTNDVALVALAAELIREPKMRAKLEFTDTKLLQEAMAKLTLPRDIETAIEINKTLEFVGAAKIATNTQKASKNINWDIISENKKAKIETDKGEIMLELFPDETPETVINFIELVNAGFYTDKIFHRVIPNFVIQTGCPRGDGYGNIEHTICSEFTTKSFGEAYIGMASAGQNTEGSQWFITHVATPHLDGRYTTFGKVTKGLDVVNKINIGDKVLKITFVD
jgi:cyclophilin family peptidyl-prolyl cis-trans isomerase/HEAT repeat protein